MANATELEMVDRLQLAAGCEPAQLRRVHGEVAAAAYRGREQEFALEARDRRVISSGRGAKKSVGMVVERVLRVIQIWDKLPKDSDSSMLHDRYR